MKYLAYYVLETLISTYLYISHLISILTFQFCFKVSTAGAALFINPSSILTEYLLCVVNAALWLGTQSTVGHDTKANPLLSQN